MALKNTIINDLPKVKSVTSFKKSSKNPLGKNL